MKKTKRLPRATFTLPKWVAAHLDILKEQNRRRSLQAAFEDAMKDAIHTQSMR